MSKEIKIMTPLVVSLVAPAKKGKTHLALSFPEPILVMSFDVKGVQIVKRKYPDKAIDVIDYPLPVIDSDPPAPFASDMLKQFNADLDKALASGKYKTLVIDPMTTLWAVVRYAVEEEGVQLGKARTYMKPNMIMKSVFDRAICAGVNFVSINHVKDKYVDDKATGDLDMDGWKGTDTKSDVIIWLRMEQKCIGGKDTVVVVSTIKGNWYDKDLNGQEIEDLKYEDLVDLLGID